MSNRSPLGAGTPAHAPGTSPLAWSPGPLLGRVLEAGTRASMLFLAIGLLVALLGGQRGGQALRPATLIHDLGHLRGTGVIGVGLVLLIATPIVREIAASVVFRRHGERLYALTGGSVLVLVAVSLIIALH